MDTIDTTNSKHKQVPISYDTHYLLLGSEPAETMSTRRTRLGAYSYGLTKRRIFRRIRRKLEAKV